MWWSGSEEYTLLWEEYTVCTETYNEKEMTANHCKPTVTMSGTTAVGPDLNQNAETIS